MSDSPTASEPIKHYDLLVIGGGINGTGIARDAAGRGLDVGLCEKDDLASHTSSASTKLIHGGLRYLEQYEFRLVRKSLRERAVLLRNAPHITRPLAFVLPHHDALRPKWILRLGLLIYDLLGGRRNLPASGRVDLRTPEFAGQLRDEYTTGFRYCDCRIDDARLVALNAVDAAGRGADIMTRTRCVNMSADAGQWRVEVETADGRTRKVTAGMLVNAAGPWAGSVANRISSSPGKKRVRLVKGSHIVVPRVHDGDHAFVFQNADGRIVFAIPYEHHYTLIGTTDVQVDTPEQGREISTDEEDYLCEAASEYLSRRLARGDIAWSFSGIRALPEDDADSLSEITRDYSFSLDDTRAPALSVYGGKITTYRSLAEDALHCLQPFTSSMGKPWTANAPLPGGDFDRNRFDDHLERHAGRYPFLDRDMLQRLFRAYGMRIDDVLARAKSLADLGDDFGCGFYEAELRYLVHREFATCGEDVLWRRTKLGLHMSPLQRERVHAWFTS